jgi:predicted polyphosphate/ATP-dependent NAD kinase
MPNRLGLLVNPVAGMGGRLGLHGTDGASCLAEARRRGATPVTPPRAKRALLRLLLADLELLTAPGAMGADVAAAAGIAAATLDLLIGPITTATDTGRVARMLADAGVALLLFAGGDGTAGDIVGAIGERVPVLGIPSGVKMRSGVFAPTPEAAGEIAARFLATGDLPVSTVEVLDAEDAGEGPGRPGGGAGSQFLGLAHVPRLHGALLPGPKVSNALASRASSEALCRAVAGELEPGTLYLFGPGSTTGQILGSLGLPSSPLGVDAVTDGVLVGEDLDEEGIIGLMERSARTRVVLGVIGGQGFLLGRGNQQLGPRALSRIRPEDLIIVSAAEKIIALDPPLLRVDVGDEAAFPWARGYLRVRVGPRRFMMMRVAGAA